MSWRVIENKLAELNKQKDFQSFEGLKEYGDLEASITKKKIERNNSVILIQQLLMVNYQI